MYWTGSEDVKKIALISLSLEAANAMTSHIMGSGKKISIVNFLDTGLMERVNREGAVSERSMSRFRGLVDRADEDAVDGILLTCTVFSPYVDRLRSLYNRPIVSADGSMIDEAVRAGGRILIVCTFPATRASITTLFHAAERRLGVKREMEVVLLTEALDALNRGDRKEHDEIITRTIHEREQGFELIVLAQMSMAHIAELPLECSIPVLSSPRAALKALLSELSGTQT